jgi:hypothetical protein
MKAVELFEQTLPRILRDAPQRAQTVGGSFLFILDGEGGGTWRVDLERIPPEVTSGPAPARCTIEAAVQDFERMLVQPTAVLQLYKEGRLQVSGELELASRLHLLFAE